jgi:hypothetical protein
MFFGSTVSLFVAGVDVAINNNSLIHFSLLLHTLSLIQFFENRLSKRASQSKSHVSQTTCCTKSCKWQSLKDLGVEVKAIIKTRNVQNISVSLIIL